MWCTWYGMPLFAPHKKRTHHWQVRLTFFQFANREFPDQFAAPPPASLFRHVALPVSTESQEGIRDRAQAAGMETMTADHGYCKSLYITDPNGLLLEFTVDHPKADEIDAIRSERGKNAHTDLSRWLSGDHTSNNDWRPDS
jgi:glyoxylase I family protein